MRITSDKKLKIAFMICSLVYFIQGGVCLIVDFALNRGVTWSAYPLLSVAFVWVLVSVLLLAPGHRIAFSLAAFSLLVFPYLYLLQTLTPVHGWFWPLAAPIAASVVPAFWLTLYLIKVYRTRKLLLYALLGIIGYAKAKGVEP